jgi:hypothetical protein
MEPLASLDDFWCTITSSMESQDALTGQLGLVLLLDGETRARAVELADQHQQGSSIDLGGRHEPHITLYHSKLANVPLDVVHEYLDHLASMLPLALTFTQIAAFGNKFLFWDTERAPELVKAHEYALGLSRYFVSVGEQQAGKEGITLSPEQSSNVNKFGNPLVGSLWRPHVTLGYFGNGLVLEDRPEIFKGSASSVAFVRVGESGTIAEIIDRRLQL